SRGLAWILTCLPPLLAIVFGFHSFIMAISLAGALSGGLQGGVLLYTYYRFKKQTILERPTEYRLSFYPLIIGWLSLVFLGGLVYAFKIIW
ncbi:MAG: hypothetical protein NTV81_04070, partial [Candidatus Komeilibacteria bacterium]|nr:hypothetical protein [Candidatus Komeilibacteria bacterium]